MSQISLSLQGVALYSKIPHENDFVFIVGHHKYRCSRILAAFISRRVSQMLMADSMTSCLKLDVQDSNYEFKQVIKLIHGNEINVCESNKKYLYEIADLLDNTEMTEQLNKVRLSKLHVRTVIEETLKKIDQDNNIDQEIDFIASHLPKFNQSEFEKFDVPILQKIFTSSSLLIDDENSLFKLIMHIIKKKSSDARVLLKCILFDHLSTTKLIEFAKEIDYNEITGGMFHSLANCLFDQSKFKTKPSLIRRISNEDTFKYNGEAFDGIFAGLNRLWKQNVFEKGIIKLTTSDGSSPYRIADNTWSDSWYSRSMPNSWVQFDFIDHAVSLSNYSLKTFIGGPNSGHLKTWVVEGSNDEKNWEEIDRRAGNSDLNDRNRFNTYDTSNKHFYRYIRLMQTGKNHRGTDFLFLNNIELFGILA